MTEVTTAHRALPSAPRKRHGNRQRLRTHAALLAAGRRLLATAPVDALSIDDIVAAADVAKGSFYNHFANKEAFAREIGAEVRIEAEQAVAAANREMTDPAVRIARALAVFIRFAIERPDSAQVLWRLNSGATMSDAPINRGLREEVQRAAQDADFNGVDVETGVLMIMGTVIISIRHALEDRLTTPAAQIATRMAIALLRGMGVPTRRARVVAESAAADILADIAGSAARAG